MKILSQRVLAKEYEKETEEKQTESGIVIPATVKREDVDNIYEVVAVGEEVSEESGIVAGSAILVGGRTAKSVDEVSLEGQQLKIFNEDQIIGVDNGKE